MFVCASLSLMIESVMFKVPAPLAIPPPSALDESPLVMIKRLKLVVVLRGVVTLKTREALLPLIVASAFVEAGAMLTASVFEFRLAAKQSAP